MVNSTKQMLGIFVYLQKGYQKKLFMRHLHRFESDPDTIIDQNIHECRESGGTCEIACLPDMYYSTFN